MKISLHRMALLAAALALLLTLQSATAQQPPPDPRRAVRQRQEALRGDALRLVELATELQKEIEKSNENVLSVTILRKAVEVERLARELRERAKE